MATVNIYDMADTWNDAGTTFTAIKMDVTDTASASGSLLMDLQVGSSSKFSVSKTSNVSFESGKINFASNGNITTYLLSGTSGGGGGFYLGGIGNTSTVGAAINYSETKLRDGAVLAWASGATINTTSDVILSRKGPANLRFGAADAAAPVAQTLSVQGGSGTNIAGANFTIQGSQSTGSAAGGSILFQVSPLGTAGTGQNGFQTALTIGPDKILVAAPPPDQNTPFVGTTTDFGLGASASFLTAIYGGTARALMGVDDGAATVKVQDSGFFGWSATSAVNATYDVALWRDTSNTLALRNGANAQTFNIYNTFTDATNYERFSIIAQSGGAVQIGTNKGSVGGTARALELQTDGQTRLTIADSGSNLYFSGSTPAIRGNANGVLYILEASAISPGGGTGYLAAANGAIKIGTANNDTLLLIGGSTDARAMFGGATSSFPAIKRSTTSLQARLADDSAFTNIQGKLTTDTAYTAGAPTPAGYLVVYDSTGTAYKIPAEAL